jgi:hypothetical protein
MKVSEILNIKELNAKVGLIGIQQNFPFALQSRVNPHAGFEVLPLTLQSEIGGHRIISLIKGNLKN